jgi:hypothetical protein
MRRAGHQGTVSLRTTPEAPPVAGPLQTFASAADVAERLRELASTVKQRIESRLPGRVRNLSVRAAADTIVIEGQCATYYTKQLAQHAALGVIEDEHLENAIIVKIGR